MAVRCRADRTGEKREVYPGVQRFMPTVDEALQIGWKQHQSGDVRGAEHVYRQVLQVAASNENAWCFLGMVCHDQARYEDAVEAYGRALAIRADFPVALSNLGNTLKQLGRLDEAIASCQKALEYNPDYSTAYNNLGVAYVAKGDMDAAKATFEKSLELMPDGVVAHSNLGAALVRQGDFKAGSEQSEAALKFDPKYAEAHKNLAIVWLLTGDFERGWPEYEWRWRCPENSLPPISQPMWDGSPLQGRTILLVAEQGLGDTLHFVRYAKLLRLQGAHVIVAAQKPLLPILAECPGVDQWVELDGTYPAFDTWAPLVSLPGLVKTTLASIPAEIPYLTADPALVQTWSDRLSVYPGFRIGIAWQGSADFHADRQRSIALGLFAPLAEIPGVQLFSLQKGFGSEQIAALNGQFDVVDFGDELDANAGPFMDTAAIMQCMDLVVSSDTSVPHLAGALGIEIWMALSLSPDWRWLLDRDDSPWYPSMRLFRQRTMGDWNDVFQRIATALRPRVESKCGVTNIVTADQQLVVDTIGQKRPASIDAERHDSTRIHIAGFNRLHTCRHGVLLFNKNDMYIGRSLERYGEFSEGELEFFESVVRLGDTVVEAGANIGAHTVRLAQLVGEAGKVHAFEPQRVVFQSLCANVALNGLANVFSHHAALGREPGQLFVPTLDYGKENNFGGLGLGGYSRGEPVAVETIDGLQLSSCGFIKIDVEGMEQDVVQGARETILQYRPVLYVENDRAEHSAALIAQIMGLGYRLYWHLPKMFRADNYYENSANVFGEIVSVNMICIDEDSELVFGDLRLITEPESDWSSQQ
ncbi:MAG TPA: FkbM family methyltransferase [Pirellulaceae bacterium]|nr:FkbM family methyltransferase [Pirellulaceae bacterium]